MYVSMKAKAQNLGGYLVWFVHEYMNEQENRLKKKKFLLFFFVFFCPKKSISTVKRKEHGIKINKKNSLIVFWEFLSDTLPGMPDIIQKKNIQKKTKKPPRYRYINTCFENVIKWF